MNEPKRSYLLYDMIGIFFGILDCFYLNWLAHISWGSLGESIPVLPIIIGMNYGIWLVPIIPVVVYEARRAQRICNPMLAGILTWSCAIFSYYFYYAALLSFGKLVHLEHFNIFGDKDETFWYHYWHMFNGIILGQFLEWIIIAVFGGSIIGALTFWFIRRSTGISHNQCRIDVLRLKIKFIEMHRYITGARIFKILRVCTPPSRVAGQLFSLHSAVPTGYNSGTDMMIQHDDYGTK